MARVEYCTSDGNLLFMVSISPFRNRWKKMRDVRSIRSFQLYRDPQLAPPTSGGSIGHQGPQCGVVSLDICIIRGGKVKRKGTITFTSCEECVRPRYNSRLAMNLKVCRAAATSLSLLSSVGDGALRQDLIALSRFRETRHAMALLSVGCR